MAGPSVLMALPAGAEPATILDEIVVTSTGRPEPSRTTPETHSVERWADSSVVTTRARLPSREMRSDATCWFFNQSAVTVRPAPSAAVGAAWWWRSDPLQARLLVGVGLVLLVGAWRHLAAVLGDRSRTSDPAVLARLTGIPRLLWNLSFLVVLALSTWWAWSALRIV